MDILETTTDLSMVEIVTLLGTDYLNEQPAQTMPKARCAPVAFANGSPVLVLDNEQRDGDVYRLIESITPADGINYYAVITGGWAAPNQNDEYQDLPPSLHPERRRVELVCLVSRDGEVASALQMEGNDGLTIDEGNAQGSLADAVAGIFA